MDAPAHPSDPTAPFDAAEVERALAGTALAGTLQHVAVTGSTNSLAVAAAQAGAAAGVWVADAQTAGRGRGGHRWHSAPGDGLYVSVLLRPRLRGVDVLKLSLAAGLAAHAAVLAAAPRAVAGLDLRWPNDMLLRGADGTLRKVGGILAESAMASGSGMLGYAVVGLGLNLNHRGFPPELAGEATSLLLETGTVIRRETVLAALLPALLGEAALLEDEAAGLPTAAAPLALRFERASTWVRGLRVQVAEDGGYTGWTEGLDAHGLLRVRTAEGTLRTVRHGGVRQL